MSSAFHYPRLARLVLLGAAGLATAGFALWTPAPSLARPMTRSTQDPYGQDPGQGVEPQIGDDGMPLPPARRRTKSAKKKGSATDKGKSKKADSSAKNKSTAKKTRAPDDGKLRFSQDIAPILVANCSGCHSGDGNGLRKGKLDLSTFEKLANGTPDHKVVQPGNPDESTLVMRIKGEIEPRMPQGNNAKLSDAAIAKIERWVKEGAALDAGHDPAKPISSYAASADQVRRADVARMPAAERDKKTQEVGLARFKQANASLKPEVVPSEHFLFFSNLPKDRATNTLKVLETQYGHLRRVLGSPGADWPEKVSIYAFSTRKDYVEFVRTVEARPDVESEESTSARFSVPQPYVAVVDPQGGRKDEPGTAGTSSRRKLRSRRSEAKVAEVTTADRNLQGILTESIGSAAVSSAGNAPRWLAAGIGAYLAAQVEPRSPYYRQLRQTALANFQQGWPTRANEALGDSDQTTPDSLRAIGFALVEAMMSSEMKQGFPNFVGGMLAGGDKLDDVLQRTYRGTREEFINDTGEWVAERYGQLR